MTAPRLLTITYAGLVLPASGYQITGVHTLDKSYDRISIEFDVVAQASSEASLKTLTDALEAAYRKPDQDLSVTVNSQSFVSGSHSSNTAFSARSRCRLLPTFRSAFSRCYRCTVDASLPADLTGRSGRRSSTVRVATDKSGVKSLAVTATFSALSSNSASTQGLAQFATYTAGIKTALSGTWQSTDEVQYEYDDQDKEATFSATYRQQILDEGESADETSYEVLEYRVNTVRPQTEGGARVGAPHRISVQFAVAVRSSQTTDLKTLYQSSVRPYLMSLATLGALDGTVEAPAVVADEVDFGVWGNTISGRLTLSALSSHVLRADKVAMEQDVLGITLVPVFGKDPYAKVLHQGPADLFRYVEITTLEIQGSEHIEALADATRSEYEANGFVLLEQSRTASSREITGPVTGDAIYKLVERAKTQRYQYARLVGGGAGGGASPGGGGATSSIRGERSARSGEL